MAPDADPLFDVPSSEPGILVLNAGSSSIRFAFHRADPSLARGLHGKLDRVDRGGCELSFARGSPGVVGERSELVAVSETARRSGARFLVDWLVGRVAFDSVRAIGHRIVHGMRHTAPERITPALLDELRRIVPFAPEHLPRELELIETLAALRPDLPQVACFDTAFHHGMPRVARMLPIPRRFESSGLLRYGFHGLSYAYLLEELARIGDAAASEGRVILAHLGSGASLAAVLDGQSIDTSMGLTPAAGLPMSTRSGDLDPGLFDQLARIERMTPARFHRMVNHESGLLGISETSGDLRDLLAREGEDVRAAEAIALFCYQTKKWIGSFAAALGGLDTLVFAGGVGENLPVVRARICEGLGFLGIDLDPERNENSIGLISAQASRVRVRVLRTDEETMIARSVLRSGVIDRRGREETRCDST